ncbi:hypothetical protein SAMN04244572_03684 [Azotobacter beijerinckii]|uniref:Transposase DDE domain-containing protein n=1 Tax=Azotobacter beijerinckii TaxID=170623 RepID=A0A1H6Y7P4_9GAMM|nr:hypothetical protein SAMN04244572_03684 [Azotobacter beijerinckii]
MSLVSLGLRPSLHAAARQMDNLPVSVTALYDKVGRTEPALLRALVRETGQRALPAGLATAHCRWQPPAGHGKAAQASAWPARSRPAGTIRGWLDRVVDLQACEDAYESERTGILPLLDGADPGQLWIADRHFCTRAILQRCEDAQAGFIVRQHAKHLMAPTLLRGEPGGALWRRRGRSTPCGAPTRKRGHDQSLEKQKTLKGLRLRMVL